MELILFASLVVAVASALWFGWVSMAVHRGLAAWAIGGLMLGFLVGGTCIGIAHSVTLPYTESARMNAVIVGAIVAVVLNGIIGALCLLVMKRHRRLAESRRV